MGEPGTKEVLSLEELEASVGLRTGRKHILSILVENKPGVLTRIAGLFARRGFNIDTLAVGPTDDPTLSRITLTSLCSCLVTWSIGCIAPSRVSVMRESVSSSVGPTASVSMLNPRRANSPAILVRTPGLFSTRIERMCLRPVRTPADASSSSRVRGSLVPGSPMP